MTEQPPGDSDREMSPDPKEAGGRYHHGNLRTALLNRAIEVIDAEGVEGMSLRRLARDLGVSHAAPARHFPTKAALLSTIVKDAYLDLTATVVKAAAGDLDPKEAARREVKAAWQWAADHPARWSVMMNPDVSRFADEDLRLALAAFVDVAAKPLWRIKAAGQFATIPDDQLKLFAFGATIGIANALTDTLLKEFLSADDDGLLQENLASLLFPMM
ncbi:putative TetR-family transcriptional regulator [Parvularcula bermudensis HTCC2503]|uniref:Putative TetR-family transcriptional regulator n=1 Tax=Parvularcula bermudensis (strain ATCC BAA-594 / HTCC2503 / KCTC 12087) TaxID=314260 RepID=E0TD70_PARBH|nr:TetR/AcrR family transcriptional regulator [Parvularcula bermudensis]ADM09893.1 putative TetR-family transcriptional regulator [Parvularcula bermudensis HTCC2503]